MEFLYDYLIVVAVAVRTPAEIFLGMWRLDLVVCDEFETTFLAGGLFSDTRLCESG
jgi:hypothetical protein